MMNCGRVNNWLATILLQSWWSANMKCIHMSRVLSKEVTSCRLNSANIRYFRWFMYLHIFQMNSLKVQAFLATRCSQIKSNPIPFDARFHWPNLFVHLGLVGFPFPNLFTDLFQTSGSVGLVPPWVRHVASAVHKAVKPPPDTWKRKTSKKLMDD